MDTLYFERVTVMRKYASKRDTQATARGPRVLDIQLRQMFEYGLVVKTVYPEQPPRSEYMMTDLGKSLLPIIDAMLKWGEEHLELLQSKYGKK